MMFRRLYLKILPHGGRDLLFRCYSRLLPKSFRRRLCFDGTLRLDVYPGELMGFTALHLPNYERVEHELFVQAVYAGCNVLDVGANMGIYTLLAAKRGARVFAVEPDPRNGALLRRNIALNGLQSAVTVFECAASDQEHSVSLQQDRRNYGATTVVPGGFIAAHPIDSLNLPPIDVCKMDIEGSELAALAGMRETLVRSPQMKLLIECGHRSDRNSLLNTLRQHFAHIAVAGEPELGPHDLPSRDCNLWCWNQ